MKDHRPSSWSGRRVLRAVAAALLLGLCLALPAAAHPLGNTSVNIYERVELGGADIRIRFVMDVSELPALDEQRFADTNDDGQVDEAETETYLDGFWTYLEPRLELNVAGVPVRLERTAQELTFPPGQGGLTLMRVVFDLVGPHPPSAEGQQLEATITERTFEGVPGWHEMIVRSTAGATLVRSDVPDTDLSSELTSYPEERISNPLSVRSASFAYELEPGAVPSARASATPVPVTPPPSAGPAPGRPDDPLVGLLGGRLTVAASGLALVAALALGAAHAISPGHGKTLVAAYVVGTRANLGQALWLGLTVAITHTAGVLLLGVGTWFAAEWFVPERVVSWLAVVTGVLVLGLGALLLWRAWRAREAIHPADATHDHPAHGRADHDHPHPHGAADRAPSLRSRDVAALGIVGGLVPSGSALLLLLSSIALGEIAFGILLILAFGVGMALVMVAIATGAVLLGRSSALAAVRGRDPRVRRLVRSVPALSGLAVVALGVILTLEAVRNIR